MVIGKKNHVLVSAPNVKGNANNDQPQANKGDGRISKETKSKDAAKARAKITGPISKS